LLALELALEYGFTDVDRKIPPLQSRDPTLGSVFNVAMPN
jgi:hypothetical protein